MNPIAKVMQHQYQNPQVRLHPPNGLDFPCQLHQPGCAGKTAKRLAANVGEGAMGSTAGSIIELCWDDLLYIYIAYMQSDLHIYNTCHVALNLRI